jgi:FMS-like tyrosine kinase 1
VRNKKLQIAELKAAGLANFEEGNVESINPEISIDEQADLLPYDKKYEFPREKLKLGKQLGAGAFGVVVKATAEKIIHYEEESTVAVKMVKKQADNEVMKALVSELKIMIHLGQHLNVVNLLGAVTKNIAKRELMVIVEYCRFGNLQSFLVKHRPYFVDQVRNDRIDPMIMKNEMRWSKLSGYNSYNGRYVEKVSCFTWCIPCCSYHPFNMIFFMTCLLTNLLRHVISSCFSSSLSFMFSFKFSNIILQKSVKLV